MRATKHGGGVRGMARWTAGMLRVLAVLPVLTPALAQDAKPKPVGKGAAQPAAAENADAADARKDADGGGEATKLRALLERLEALSPAAWAAELDALRGRIAAHRKRSKELAEQAAALQAKAARADAAARELQAEIARLNDLQSLVGGGSEASSGQTGAVKKGPAGQARMAEAQREKASEKPKMAGQAEAAAAEPASEPKPEAKKPKSEAEKPQPKSTGKKPSTSKAKGKPKAGGADERLVSYAEDVWPIFDEHCVTCHEPGDASGGLDVTTHAAVLQGGSSGRTLVPGEPENSRLYLLVAHKATPTMPKDDGKIPAAQIETIRTWIAHGVPEDREAAAELAEKRAAARAAEAERAAAAAGNRAQAAEVMPHDLPPVEKSIARNAPPIEAVAVSATSPLLAVSGLGQVLLYRTRDLQEIGVLPFPYARIAALRFSADGTRLVAAGGTPGERGGAVLYDVASGTPLGRFGETFDSQLAADVGPDGAVVAVGGTTRRVEVYAVEDGERLFVLAHDDWVTAIDISADGRLLGSADRAGGVLVTEVGTGRNVHRLRGHEGAVHAVAFRADAAVLASAGEDRSVRAWRMRDGRPLWNQRRHGGAAVCLTWCGRDRLASGGADGLLLPWKQDGGRAGRLPAVGEWVYGLAFDARTDRLFAGDWRGRLTVIDGKAREIARRMVPVSVDS